MKRASAVCGSAGQADRVASTGCAVLARSWFFCRIISLKCRTGSQLWPSVGSRVDIFFVLSGFLITRLVLDKGDRQSFFLVFYIRRVCRTFPIYFVCLSIVVVLMSSGRIAGRV